MPTALAGVSKTGSSLIINFSYPVRSHLVALFIAEQEQGIGLRRQGHLTFDDQHQAIDGFAEVDGHAVEVHLWHVFEQFHRRSASTSSLTQAIGVCVSQLKPASASRSA